MELISDDFVIFCYHTGRDLFQLKDGAMKQIIGTMDFSIVGIKNPVAKVRRAVKYWAKED